MKRWMSCSRVCLLVPILVLAMGACAPKPQSRALLTREAFSDDLKARTFEYFWEVVDSMTWQSDDRHPTKNFTSIAATGFALPAYLIGIENGYITRMQGAERVLNVLRWLEKSPQGEAAEGTTGYRGFYYHFLNYGSGTRFKQVELSTIDTGLLMAGMLACQVYFDGEGADEAEIRELVDALYRRVEWDWAMNGQKTMSMGWHPEKGFIPASWKGYNEAMILLIMALGSPTHAIPSDSWEHWCETYEWLDFYGYEHVNFAPLFGHQYSHMFIDFRGIQDAYMQEKGIDYFENSRRATLANRAYCIDNPRQFAGYGANVWGLTACDGPANASHTVNGLANDFFTYRARGASAAEVVDDGTIAPTAAGGSIVFAPEECMSALYTMYELYGTKLYHEYGFRDAFNLTYTFEPGTEDGWFDPDYIGIDQGPILIQLENYQSGLIWDLMKRNPYIVSGLRTAGFTGGWLNQEQSVK